MTALLVAVGAAVGAPLRYLVDQAVQARLGSSLPWGTFVVNVAGSLLLGVLVGAATAGVLPAGAGALLGTGLCGALTTYSTFGYQTVALLTAGRTRYALLNVAASVTVGLAAASVGVLAAGLLWG